MLYKVTVRKDDTGLVTLNQPSCVMSVTVMHYQGVGFKRKTSPYTGSESQQKIWGFLLQDMVAKE